jgi:hypothetical protein
MCVGRDTSAASVASQQIDPILPHFCRYSTMSSNLHEAENLQRATIPLIVIPVLL